MSLTISGASTHPALMRLANAGGYVLLALLALCAAIPFLVRSFAGFGLLAVALLLFILLPMRLLKSPAIYRLFGLNILFVTLGTVIILLSFLGVFDQFPLWPVRPEYILRQSYFIFLWLPLSLAAVVFWSWNWDAINALLAPKGLWVALAILMADIMTSAILGDSRTRIWVGYVFYFDKLIIAFLFVLSLACYMAAHPGSIMVPAVILGGYVTSRLLHMGILFNAQTGFLLMTVLLLTWIPNLPLHVRMISVLVLFLLIHAVLIYGLFDEHLFAGDDNTVWRLHAWRDNLRMVWESNFSGLGFGTPYHAQSAENLRNTALNESDLLQGGPTDLIEPQYFRGQHSSYVNVFYRMGVLGGLMFAAINLIALLQCILAVRNSLDLRCRRLCFVGFLLLMIQNLQMSLHVGLETPRFLVVYFLCLGLAMAAPFVILEKQEGVKNSS